MNGDKSVFRYLCLMMFYAYNYLYDYMRVRESICMHMSLSKYETLILCFKLNLPGIY
jgi:hypothetical protein